VPFVAQHFQCLVKVCKNIAAESAIVGFAIPLGISVNRTMGTGVSNIRPLRPIQRVPSHSSLHFLRVGVMWRRKWFLKQRSVMNYPRVNRSHFPIHPLHFVKSSFN
jgi:hypothetical protein